MNLSEYSRRPSGEVRIGRVVIGGGHPVAVQSMTNTDTNDTEACAAQIERIDRAGGGIVRLTAQGRREGENLANIVRRVREDGFDTAIVADIHFVPEVAAIAAKYVDKVRINPGNYRTDHGELEALIAQCRERGVALRIGVNHGSLSKRVFDRWGDTPQGMVVSAMEFLRVCKAQGFDQVVVSMKSSNTRVMVAAYRLLVEAMDAEDMHYPIHLGVTEAGNGIEGRIKSAVGIGALMADGIGDTIRVSLTEAPENEIPVAELLVKHFARRPGKFPVLHPERYSLILLDVMMGEMSGFRMAQLLKADPETARVPVIFCTAKDSEDDTVAGLNIGADDYITKPFSVREVLARVRSVLRRTSAARAESESIRFEGLEIDLRRKVCTLDGKELQLTKKEFEILALLLSNRGVIFSREEILRRIWSDEVIVLDRTVDVNITRLRRKVGPYGEHIVTRLGYGYGFEA